jgi:hypothetical protein
MELSNEAKELIASFKNVDMIIRQDEQGEEKVK